MDTINIKSIIKHLIEIIGAIIGFLIWNTWGIIGAIITLIVIAAFHTLAYVVENKLTSYDNR